MGLLSGPSVGVLLNGGLHLRMPGTTPRSKQHKSIAELGSCFYFTWLVLTAPGLIVAETRVSSLDLITGTGVYHRICG